MTHRYTHETEAAYMAQAHGFRFHEDGLTVKDEYVLLPQPGDLVLIARGNEAHQVQRTTRLAGAEKIIMRDGKAFIWPEKEAA